MSLGLKDVSQAYDNLVDLKVQIEKPKVEEIHDSCANCRNPFTNGFMTSITVKDEMQVSTENAFETIFNLALKTQIPTTMAITYSNPNPSKLGKAFLCLECGKLLELAYGAIMSLIKVSKNEDLLELGLSKKIELSCEQREFLKTREIKKDYLEEKESIIKEKAQFKCVPCGRQFAKYSFLQKHRKRFHGERVVQTLSSLTRRQFRRRAVQNKIRMRRLQDQVFNIWDEERSASPESNDEISEREGVKTETGISISRNDFGSDTTSASKLSYKCEVCDKTFLRSDFLAVHVRSHTGEKPFSCDTCGKQFSDPKGLDNHLITHSDARPFCCSICGLTFKRSHHLRDHEKNHKDLPRAFKCSTCGKAFKFKKHFNSHQLSHQRTKQFQCELCLKFFSRKDNLLQHSRNVHHKKDLNITENST